MKQKETPPTPTKEQYLEPVGFKGTPGKLFFRILEPAIGLTTYGIDMDGNETEDQALANAKLISQSKELAKALQGFIHNWENLGQPDEYRNVATNAKQVLKEACLTNE